MFVWVAMTVIMVGWDYQGTDPPRRHRHLFARSEFHKTRANAAANARSQSSRASAYRIDRNPVTGIRHGG
jgi:hypothetical protein